MAGVHRLTPEPFVETGRTAGIPVPLAPGGLADLVEARDAAFVRVCERRPDGFPPAIREPILEAAVRQDGIARYLTRRYGAPAKAPPGPQPRAAWRATTVATASVRRLA